MAKVEKNKKNSNSLSIIRGKNKVIRLKTNESIMEGNCVDMPFIAPYRGDPIVSIKYLWNTNEKGVSIQRGIKLKGDTELGVPTLKDKKVLRALQHLYIWSKMNNGELKLETDPEKIKESDLYIEFNTVTDIGKAMGLKSISTQQRDSIKKSIERLAGTEIEMLHNGGIFDPVTKRYIINSSKNFRYIEKRENYEYYDCTGCDNLKVCELYFASENKNKKDICIKPEQLKHDHTKIKLSLEFYLSLANNYTLFYNNENANAIKNLIAENIYLISRKWIGKGNTSVANIQKYIDRIPMNAKEDKEKKQVIREAVRLLDKYDFVKASIEKNDIIKITHLDKGKAEDNILEIDSPQKEFDPDTDDYIKNKYNTFNDFRNGLYEIGLTDQEFNILMDKYIQDIEYLKALLRYVVIKSKYNIEVIPKKYYLNCINAKIKLDKKYYNTGC